MHLTRISTWRADDITPLFTDLVVDAAAEGALQSFDEVRCFGLLRDLLVVVKPFVAVFIIIGLLEERKGTKLV